jgi:DNA gyrase inhibitor GyrI
MVGGGRYAIIDRETEADKCKQIDRRIYREMNGCSDDWIDECSGWFDEWAVELMLEG